MKQKIINLYQFEELTDEQKTKVLDKHRDIEVELMNANDDTYTNPIHDAGFLAPDVYCDLSYCQGSGACFDCNEFDFDLLLKSWEHPHKKWIIDIIKAYFRPTIETTTYRYSHEKSRCFGLFDDLPKNCKHIEEATFLAQVYIEGLRFELSKKLTEQLYNDLEYLRSDEVVKDFLISNDYYFNGETLEIEY